MFTTRISWPTGALGLAALVVTASSAMAALKTWSVPAGSWFTNENWIPMGAPTSDDDVLINNGGEAVVDSLGTANALVVDVLNAGSTLSVDQDATLTVGNTVSVSGGKIILVGGTLVMAPGARLTLGGPNGNGQLLLHPGGTVVVNGTNGLQRHASSTAAVACTEGRFVIYNGAFSTSVGLTLASRVTFETLTSADVGTFSGPITGNAVLIKDGPGNIELAGANSYTRGTAVLGGVLYPTVNGGLPSGTPYAVHGGELALNGFPLTMSVLEGIGGRISLGNQNLTVNQSTNHSYAGVIAGTGRLIKNGPGTLTLSGAHVYTGGTDVNNGALVVNGSITGTTTVGSAGGLGGIGTVSGPIVMNGGPLAPGPGGGANPLAGGGPGRLTCTGGVTNSGGRLRIDITGPEAGTQYDQLEITSGTFDLGVMGLEFSPTPSGTFSAASKLYIVKATGSGNITGRFGGLFDQGAAGTVVPELANLGGFPVWRIYYHADSESNTLTGGNDIALAPIASAVVLGDMNCDGVVSVTDIAGFVLALTDPAGYAAQFPGCNIHNGDVNQDGSVTVTDIGPFVAALTGG